MQVVGVLDAMPATNLKPEEEDGILEENRVYRTTYMFSATMPPIVERLARKYMRRPAVINIGSAGKATDNVTQKARLPFHYCLCFSCTGRLSTLQLNIMGKLVPSSDSDHIFLAKQRLLP